MEIKLTSYVLLILMALFFGVQPVTAAEKKMDKYEKELDRFSKGIGITQEEACKAINNVEIKKSDEKIQECKKNGDIKVVNPNAGCKSHYTIFSEGGEKKCMCNNPGHSELLILEKYPKIGEMTNQRGPCTACFIEIIKHMVKENRLDSGSKLVVKFGSPGSVTSWEKYQRLQHACNKH